MASNGELPTALEPTADWQNAPFLTGSTKYEPLSDVTNILVTGGAGFIASWVVKHLTTRYPTYNIICLDKLDYCATLHNLKCLEDYRNFKFCYGDITNGDDVLRVMKKYGIDTVLHFAAQSHVDLSFENSLKFTKTNVEGTHIMLECAVRVGTIRRFIHVSTDEVMGEVSFGDADLLENSVLCPTNPYSASKAAAEMYVNAYAKSFKLPVIIVRSNNVYGPHQFPEKIIPKFSCLLARGMPLTLHGNGRNTRRYLFAGDAADAFDTILHRGKVGEIYNVDSGDEVSNRDLAIKLLELFGVPREDQAARLRFTQDRPFNDKRYAVDGSKLRSIGWVQRTNFEQGLKMTVEWYRRFGTTWWGDIEGMLTMPFVPAAPKTEKLSTHGAETLVSGRVVGDFHGEATENPECMPTPRLIPAAVTAA